MDNLEKIKTQILEQQHFTNIESKLCMINEDTYPHEKYWNVGTTLNLDDTVMSRQLYKNGCVVMAKISKEKVKHCLFFQIILFFFLQPVGKSFRYAFNIFVKTPGEETLQLLVHWDMDVMELKELIHNKKNMPIYDQRLTFNGTRLEEDRILGNYYLQNEDIIHLTSAPRGGMYHFTSGRQDFFALPYNGADAIKNVLTFNTKHVKHARHLTSAKLQEFVLEGRAVLSTLYRKIQNVYVYQDIPDLKKIILPTITDNEDSSDSNDDDMSSDE